MRAALENASPPHLWIRELREEDRIDCCYLVRRKSVGTTRKGEPFISLTLADRTGEVEAKVWERASEFSRLFREGDVIQVEGYAGSYKAQVQLTLTGIRLPVMEWDPALFLEASPRDPAEMMRELRDLLMSVRENHLRSLVERFLGDHDLVTRFKKAPAAKNFHHNYLGGLLEHTISVCRLASQVAEFYPQLDRDLLLTAAFLHDIGKVRELSCRLQIDYTDEGRLLGHLVIGAAMVDEKLTCLKQFPPELALRLKHLILSHHGEYEFGSPKRPKFLEGFALHLVDDLDAKINGLGRFMEKDQQEGSWTEFNRLFSRYLMKGAVLLQDTPSPENGEKEGRQQGLFSRTP